MAIKLIKLQCVLLDNNEIFFNKRSLGFITNEEKKKYVEDYD